jgi:hypothetical protein
MRLVARLATAVLRSPGAPHIVDDFVGECDEAVDGVGRGLRTSAYSLCEESDPGVEVARPAHVQQMIEVRDS